MDRKEKDNKNIDTKADLQKIAVALSYDIEDSAPRIVASGKGYLADKILEVGEQAKVPIHKDEGLAKTLSKLDLGDSIPPELYEVVAQILIYVDRVDTIKKRSEMRKMNLKDNHTQLD